MHAFNNILYPINLDSENINSVVKALEIAMTLKSRIHILYVNNAAAGYRYPADHEDAISLRLQEVVQDEILQKSNITYAVAKGDLAEEISVYCKNNNIDLIITGHKHRNKLYSMLFDSPDVNIIDSINIPILVIPRK
jgi:nucleotide-binding universal stress UspA family protein